MPNTTIDKFARIRHLTLEDTPKAVATLLKSFELDALARLLTNHISDEAERLKIDALLYETYVRQHILKGVVLGIGETETEFETVALWSTPTSIDEGLEEFTTLMEAGYGRLWDIAGNAGRDKIFKGMLPLLHDTCMKIMDTDSRFRGKGVFTLVYLGSVASARGKGNVRLMFDYMFEKYIDLPNTNHIAYLESSAASNIPIYNKFHFHQREDIMLGSKEKPDAKEGDDYAVMHVMIRDSYGHDWTVDAVSPAKL